MTSTNRNRLFGTDGIRAKAGLFPLDPATVESLGRNLVRLGRRNVLIGRDTRASGPWLEDRLGCGIESENGQVLRVGVLPSPGISYLTRSGSFDAGVMISASHNPYEDNGIKIFSGRGLKLSDEEERKLEEAILAEPGAARDAYENRPPGASELIDFEDEPGGQYLRFLASIPGGTSLSSLKVVLDCGNGAGSRVAPLVFRELGAEVTALHDQPDGTNINENCGALHPESLAIAVREQNAAFGLALDGDADRSILVDETGRLLDGDAILYILARHLKAKGLLDQSCVVATVMSNLGLERALEEEGIQLRRTPVGDRYVLEEMLAGGHVLGGEQSGHIILLHHSPSGDGIQTALKVASVMLEERVTLSELVQGFVRLPQKIRNVRIREKRDFETIPEVHDLICEVEDRLHDRGRLLVRFSGTEPLVRIMIEGEDEQEITQLTEMLAQRFEEQLGI